MYGGVFGANDNVPCGNNSVLPTIVTENAAESETLAMPDETVPRDDQSFARFIAQFAQTATLHAAQLPFSPQEIAQVASLKETIAQNLQAIVNQRAALRAAVAVKEETLSNAESFVRGLVKKVQADPSIPTVLAKNMGIVVRKKGVVRPVHTPHDLLSAVQAGGYTLLTWNGGPNARGTTFCVEKKTANAADFAIVGITSKTRFRDDKAVPGEKAVYRVFAQRADRSSVPSTPVVMYGA